MTQYTSVFKRTPAATNGRKVTQSLLFPARIFDADSFAGFVHACVAFLGLIVCSPLIVLIGLAIKLTDGGTIFYRGKRIGQAGRIFWIYKFRTLKEGAEKDIGARLLNDTDRACYMTKIGRFLKRSKLDELPQLLNVIRGEMRLAGPRPLRPIFLSQFEQDIPNYMTRFEVPPGITGIAQLRGGYYTSPRNKLRYDRIYIRNASLLLDLQIVLLTFVKILNRWLTLGFFGLFLFLFVSFVPASERPVWRLSIGGLDIEPVPCLILLATVWVLFKRGPAQFSLYRGPLNLPIFLFLCLGMLSAFTATDPIPVLQLTMSYVVTGFLISFLIVNSFATREFFTLTARGIALTSVIVCLFGLFQIFLFLTEFVPAESASISTEALLTNYQRISSVFENSRVLAVYLVLGIPLLLSELIRSHGRARDFWLICVTLAFMSVFFTQTRIGLFALLVTSVVFLVRRPTQAFSFLALFLLFFLFVSSLGASWLSPERLWTAASSRAAQYSQDLQDSIPTKTGWLIGVGPRPSASRQAEERSTSPVVPRMQGEAQPDPDPAGRAHRPKIQNMHLTLIVEYGLVGWLLTLWIIFSALRVMMQAYGKIKSEGIQSILWAVISSIIGFLISMNVMNTFHHLTLQVFFWSLIGIGLGIVVHQNGGRRDNIIWRFGDAGD